MPANSALRKLPALLLGILLVVCLLAYYSTRDSATPASQRNSPAAGQPLVDTSLLQSVMSLSALAATPDEQAQAREAWRFADHELDLRFAATIRRAEAEATAPASGPLKQLADHIAQLQARVATDKKRVEELSKDTTGALD